MDITTGAVRRLTHIRISQFVLAGAVSAVGLVGFGGVANAAPISGTGTVVCVQSSPVVVAVESGSESVSTPITCDDPVCVDGALTVVVDDSGVQHQACVASAVAVPPATTARVTFALPVDSASTASPAVLPATGRGSGDGLALAAVLVGCGSLASFVSRRKV
jgi:hypothetical protein